MSGRDWQNCKPSFNVPIMQISGTEDKTVPWDGTMSTAYGWGGAPHIVKVVDFWAEKNGCNVDEKINFPDLDRSDKSTVSLVFIHFISACLFFLNVLRISSSANAGPIKSILLKSNSILLYPCIFRKTLFA